MKNKISDVTSDKVYVTKTPKMLPVEKNMNSQH
jgi:hypothetical protein